MAEIKISDLSIGDWVKASGVAKRVHSIEYQNGAYFVNFSDPDTNSEDYMHAPLVKPIPLTPEILEKNGFVKGEIYEGNSSIVFTNGNISISWFKKSKWYRLRIYNALGDTELCSAIVHNVHQMQHALRLAGVEKEIEV